MESGDAIISRAVASQVPSARGGLTSVFGMGTGGALQPLSPEIVVLPHSENYTGTQFDPAIVSLLSVSFRFASATQRLRFFLSLLYSDQALDRLVSASSRITALSPLTYLPCRLQGVLLACAMAVLFLRWASRLDAFSVYPIRTSLPCYAVGTTTVAPVVRPSRSSRTRDSSSHDSCAHDG